MSGEAVSHTDKLTKLWEGLKGVDGSQLGEVLMMGRGQHEIVAVQLKAGILLFSINYFLGYRVELKELHKKDPIFRTALSQPGIDKKRGKCYTRKKFLIPLCIWKIQYVTMKVTMLFHFTWNLLP